MTVYAGTQKITVGRDKRQDAIDAQNALRQAGPNSFVEGVQSVMKDGAAVPIENSRTPYGAVTVMPQEILQGRNNNFAYKDSPGNQPNAEINQSGSLENQVSSTNVPQQDPPEMESDAVARRIRMYQRAAGNADASANDRSQTMRA